MITIFIITTFSVIIIPAIITISSAFKVFSSG